MGVLRNDDCIGMVESYKCLHEVMYAVKQSRGGF